MKLDRSARVLRVVGLAAVVVGAAGCAAQTASTNLGGSGSMGGSGHAPVAGPEVKSEPTYYEQDSRRSAGVFLTSSIDLTKLPIGDIPDLTDAAKNKPTSVSPSEMPANFEIKKADMPSYYGYDAFKPVQVRPKDFKLLEAFVGPAYNSAAWSQDGAATVFCGSVATSYGAAQTYYGYGNRILQAHFEGLTRKGGALQYTYVDGWMDTENCALKIDKTASFGISEIVPGLVFGFRSCSHHSDPPPNATDPTAPIAIETEDKPKADAECVSPDKLTLLTPRSVAFASTYQKVGSATPAGGYSPFARFSLPLRHGTGDSATLTIARGDVDRWTKAIEQDLSIVVPVESSTQTFNVGVEVQQAIRDREATAQVFLSVPQPPTPQQPLVRTPARVLID
ncbi:MAG: hypothetical protein U0271_40545 [Polyangiaceae bacterium]